MTRIHFSLLSALGLAALGLSACSTTAANSSVKLAPGQFEWAPEKSSSGPLLVVISIDDQMAHVYRNGVEIARSTVSTGRPGKETPTGVFTILQRKVDHESNIYIGAKMPYMQRLTWTGIAMHAGDLPGYPASGGCIRLPFAFSEKIYSIMENGSTVVITKKGAQPSKSTKPANLLLASRAKVSSNKAIPKGRSVWQPGKSRSGQFTILLSYADRTVYLWRNGVQIGQSPIEIAPGAAPPEGVFMMLEGTEPPDRRFPGVTMHPWSVLSLNGGAPTRDAIATIRSRISAPDGFWKQVSAELTPGTLMLATSESSNATTRSGTDFTIMKPEAKSE